MARFRAQFRYANRGSAQLSPIKETRKESNPQQNVLSTTCRATDDTQGHESRFKPRKQSAYRARGRPLVPKKGLGCRAECFQSHEVVHRPSDSCSNIPIWNVCKPFSVNPHQGFIYLEQKPWHIPRGSISIPSGSRLPIS
jgi:hypothetical protein